MIRSADEFLALRYSDDKEQYDRAAHEEAPIEVWRELVDSYPESRFWVAHNKSVPLDILRMLATDIDPHVRGMVAGKRKPTSRLKNSFRGIAMTASEWR